jgi:hypothetical protein
VRQSRASSVRGKLGRAAADVGDQVRGFVPVLARAQFPGGAGEGQSGLFIPGDDLGHDAEDLLDLTGEIGGVLRVPAGAGRDHPDGGGAVPGDLVRVAPERADRPVDRRLGQAAGPVHAFSQPDDLHVARDISKHPAFGVDVGD